MLLRLLRLVSLLLGLAFLTFSALIRYTGNAISAGHGLVYFKFWRSLPQNYIVVPLVLLVGLLVFVILALLLIPAVRGAVGNLLRERGNRLWLAGALFVWLLTMIPIDAPQDPKYATDQEMYVYLIFGSLGTLLFLLGLGRGLDSVGRWAERVHDRLMTLPARYLVIGAALFVFFVTNLISWLVFHHIPHIHDTVAQVFQARIFAQGKLFAESPPYRQFYDLQHIINNGRWYSQYPFGHPLLLMLGVFIGAPWIINPLCGALTVVVIYYLGREVYDERTARLGLILASLSPFLVFMSGEFMNHSSALLFAALFMLCYARAFRVSDSGLLTTKTPRHQEETGGSGLRIPDSGVLTTKAPRHQEETGGSGLRTPDSGAGTTDDHRHTPMVGESGDSAIRIPQSAIPISVQQRPSAVAHPNPQSESSIPHSALRIPHWFYALLAGLCLGFVFDIRPMTAALIAVPFVLDAGWRLYRDWRAHVVRVGVLVAGGMVLVGLLLLYNYLTNGDPFLFGYIVKWGRGHEIGFGRSGWGEAYTLSRALISNGIELYGLNRYLFEFPIPSLVFIVLLFAARTRDRWDWLLVGTIVSVTIGYFFYWWHAILFGPRWQFETLPALILLTARGIRAVPGFLRDRLRVNLPVENIRRSLGKLLLLCYISMLAVAVPTLVRQYLFGFGVKHTTAENVRKAGVHNAVIFAKKYDDVLLENQLPPGGDIVWAKDLGSLNPILNRQFPGRKYYFAHRDTLRELENMDFERSAIKEGLDSLLRALDTTDLGGYQTLLWPVAELKPMVQPLADRRGLQVKTYREVSQECVGDVRGFLRDLPALAAWVKKDRSDGLVIFAMMDHEKDIILGEYRLTHVTTAVNGRVVLFDIQRYNGEGDFEQYEE